MRWLVLLLLTMAPASAQTPVDQVLSQEIVTQLEGKLACTVALKTAQARIKELEDKYEKKPDAKQK